MEPGKVYRLALPFKGDRDYIHGTDIANSLVALVDGKPSDITIQFHSMVSHPLKVWIADKVELTQMRKEHLLSVLMAYKDENKVTYLVVSTEDLNTKNSDRYEYNEAKVLKEANIKGNSIEQLKPARGNFYERIVAMNKYLMNSIIEKRPWLFSRLDLVRIPDRVDAIKITYMHDISGHTYKSTISVDGENIGSLFFTRRLE